MSLFQELNEMRQLGERRRNEALHGEARAAAYRQRVQDDAWAREHFKKLGPILKKAADAGHDEVFCAVLYFGQQDVVVPPPPSENRHHECHVKLLGRAKALQDYILGCHCPLTSRLFYFHQSSRLYAPQRWSYYYFSDAQAFMESYPVSEVPLAGIDGVFLSVRW